MNYEVYAWQQKFKQKDDPIPPIPAIILPRKGMPLEYKPFQPTPKVSQPASDSYLRF
jgi:hypothetical protein